ncbi:MAG: hypothetical protein ABH879_00535 [archaeon]
MEKSDSYQKRQVAYKVIIRELIEGKHVVTNGWEPNYILLADGTRVSRANILGVIISKGDGYLQIDDGSGNISVRSFDESASFENHNIGDSVILIGRPREYGNERYIVPEILKKMSDPLWMNVRKLELQLRAAPLPCAEEPPDRPVETEESNDNSMDMTQKIYELIKELDAGHGANFEEVIEKSGAGDAEKIVNSLLKEGDIFEVSAGKLKVL